MLTCGGVKVFVSHSAGRSAVGHRGRKSLQRRFLNILDLGCNMQGTEIAASLKVRKFKPPVSMDTIIVLLESQDGNGTAAAAAP